jgi:hypothetical protein
MEKWTYNSLKCTTGTECMFILLVISMESTCAVIYCHVWPVRLYHIFPHYQITSTIFGKTLLYIKYVFWYSVQLLSETFNRARYLKCTHYSCQILLKLEFSQRSFKIYWNMKFYDNQLEPSCFVWTDRKAHRHGKANSCVLQFCEHTCNKSLWCV